jgi:hypothetical protein
LDWNEFVKAVLIDSCQGAVTRAGLVIPARAVADNSEQRIRYEIKQYGQGNPAPQGRTDSGAIEPTWANPTKIVRCLSGLNPTNVAALQSAFGAGGLLGSTRIHAVRNACAHKSRHNRLEVATLRASYITAHYLDPIDIVWAIDALSGTTAIFDWMVDLETVADLATH